MDPLSIIGENIDGFEIQNFVGDGAIGHVYKARNVKTKTSRAIKFIPYDKLRPGWENEITKPNLLVENDNVVRYYTHDNISFGSQDYLYIMWHYIDGSSLKEIIEKKALTIELLYSIVKCILEVLHSCAAVSIVHADLHSGNILIQKENPINMDPTYRKIWVTDFGYLTPTAHDKDRLDDYKGLNRIIKDGLDSINFNAEDGEGKKLFRYFRNEFSRLLLEDNPTQGEHVRNAKGLHKQLTNFKNNIDVKQTEMPWGISDFLAAEHLGDSFEEWKALFVPKFVAIDELLERNITVLTGLRGCGKTMLFRRLTAFFNIKLGSSGVDGSDCFLGFYSNARNISEAFPWLPEERIPEARNQIIHHFHLHWTIEMLEWLNLESVNKEIDQRFLNVFFRQYLPSYYTSEIAFSISYIIRMMKDELESSRLLSCYDATSLWSFSQYNYLETFVKLIKENLPEFNMPFYFFLDDYSSPIVQSSLQQVLNPIIFRRSADVVFKVSTESVESFVPLSLNGKVLEENADYKLIDCGTLLLRRGTAENFAILSDVLKPRIERHSSLRGRDLDLDTILGKTEHDNTERAEIIKHGKKANVYQGSGVFARLWSSDIREMINVFAQMIQLEKEENLKKTGSPLISPSIQDKIYRDTGGQFINLLSSATNPSDKIVRDDQSHTYGQHLVEIVKAFHTVALFGVKNKTSKNQERTTIKQARRIEVTNVEDKLSEEAKSYYRGLLRYGIFIRDFRGKSVRGQVVPRLVLRGTLVPFFTLTFSRRDSIFMTWEDFVLFLEDPTEYAKQYIEKHSDSLKSKDSRQLSFDDLDIENDG